MSKYNYQLTTVKDGKEVKIGKPIADYGEAQAKRAEYMRKNGGHVIIKQIKA